MKKKMSVKAKKPSRRARAYGPGVSIGFESPTLKALYVAIIEATAGAKPMLTRDGDITIYSDHLASRKVIDLVSGVALDRLKSKIVINLLVDDPAAAAGMAAELLEDNGVTCEIIDLREFRPQAPAGFMFYLVCSEEPDNYPILFWKREPTKRELSQVPQAKKWRGR